MEQEATYRGTVYPWQCDHVGHMNIMWYVGKFDEANWNLFARLGLTPSYLHGSGRGMAAVQQNVTYKRERLAGDIVGIRSHLLEIRTNRSASGMPRPTRSPHSARSRSCTCANRCRSRMPSARSP